MASIIRIKRSGVTGTPGSLAQGELAYSYLEYNPVTGQGGDRLYIGTGTETNGEAANVEVIGGKYFTSKLDHAPGTLTSNSAIIVDDNKSINELIIGNNVTIANNTISTTSGDLTIDPEGNLEIISNVNIDGNLNVNGIDISGGAEISGNTVIASLEVSDLTEDRIVFVGPNGKLIDSPQLTFNGSAFEIDALTVTITGDLVVAGNTTIVNSEEVFIKDNIIVLNSNLEETVSPTLNAGIEINRGLAPNVSFLWDEAADQWTLGSRKLAADEFIGKIDGGTY